VEQQRLLTDYLQVPAAMQMHSKYGNSWKHLYRNVWQRWTNRQKNDYP